MNPVSVSAVVFDGHPLDVALDALAACGASLAELAFIEGQGDFDEDAFTAHAARGARRSLDGAGLGSVALSAHMDLGGADVLDRLSRRIAFARGIGAGILVTNTGAKARAAQVERVIEAVLPVCADAGVVLAIENPGYGPDTMFGRADEGVALVRRFASPWFGVNYDVGNALTQSEGAVRPETDIQAATPACVHAHLKDVRVEGSDWRYVAIGDGSVDYAAIAGTLARDKPDIPVCLELPLRLQRPLGLPPVRSHEPVPLNAAKAVVRRSLDNWARIRGAQT